MSIPTAYQHKDAGYSMAAAVRNDAIQAERDGTRCTCGHLNVSHGYGHNAKSEAWPDGSRIGMGACGLGSCTCEAFRAVHA